MLFTSQIMDNTNKPYLTKDLALLRGIKLGALNIRSVIHKLDDIEILLNQSKLDYLGLCESWLTSDIDHEHVQLPGYNTVRLDRNNASGKSGGGDILVYCSKKYNFTHIQEWDLITPDVEWVWVRLELKATRPTFVACIYRPPGGSVDNFIDLIENKLLDI